MSDPTADSAGAEGEATGAATAAADSTPTPQANGQEQGDQSNKRVNDLMSLANRRLLERDAARAEIETLKAQLAEREVVAQDPSLSQAEAMYPERYEQPDDDDGEAIDPMEQPEPRRILFDPNAARRPSSTAYQPAAPTPTNPSERFLRDQSEIAAMKSSLNAAGARWYEGAKEQGLLD